MAGQPQASAQAAAVVNDKAVDLCKQFDIDVDHKHAVAGALAELFTAVPDGQTIKIDKQVVDAVISAIDQKLSSQVNQILHHPDFQRMESTWRSLKHLVDNTEFRENTRIEILSSTKEDLLADFEDAPDWQKSGLFSQVYQKEYNVHGGEPYGLMVSGFQFDYRAPEVKLLSEIARVSAVAKCPFIAGASPKMFGKRDSNYESLPRKAEMFEIFDDKQHPEYVKWNAFRDSDDARYIGLTAPRFMLRKPYTVEDQAVKDFVFEEDVRVENHDRYLWGQSSYAMAGRMTQSFAKFGWYQAVVGPRTGGEVGELPLHTYEAMGNPVTKIPTEAMITEDVDVDMCNFGFIPLVMRKYADNACFFDAPSARRVPKFADTPQGKENEARFRIGASLPYTMISCRIAHYLKVIWRENIGRVMDPEKMRKEMQEWLEQYRRQIVDDDELAARYPLKEVQITAQAVEGKPGYFTSIVQMVPHFKLKGVEINLQMANQLDPQK